MVAQFFSQALARPIVTASTTLELISGPSNFHLEIENRPSLRRGQKLTRLVDIDGQGSCLSQGSNTYAENHKDICFYKDNYSALDNDRGIYLTDTDADADVDADTEIDTDTDTLSAVPQPYLKPFDKLEFARVYHLAALRVPAAESKSIAYRLQGHLLNWPKISNVARVDGDDLDENAKSLLRTGRTHSQVDTDSILQAVYGIKRPSSGLIERVQAAEKFRVQGSLQFPALERISQSGRNVFRKKMKPKDNNTTKFHNKFYTVELDTSQDDGQEFEISLERMGFGMKKWRGPSRLLLLDPGYAGKSVTELPMAIQTLLNQQIAEGKERSTVRSNRKAIVRTNGTLNQEIVPCKLTLFYEFWSLEEILEELLPREESRPFMMEVIGHIGILKLSKHSLPLKRVIAKVILDKKWPKVKTIINQFGVVEGTRQLEVLAGNHALVTTVVENGFSFQFNLATLYWDMELAKERERLLMSFSKTDVVCDVFAGAGALALPAAKKVWRVFANESNPDVMKYLAKNVSQHKLQGKIEVYGLDGPAFVRSLLAFSKPVRMTQVILSCSLKGEACLDAFIGTFNQHNWNANQPMPGIHLYGTSDALDPENDFLERITCRLGSRPERIGMYRVQLMECGRWMLRATFQLPESAAFPNSF